MLLETKIIIKFKIKNLWDTQVFYKSSLSTMNKKIFYSDQMNVFFMYT